MDQSAQWRHLADPLVGSEARVFANEVVKPCADQIDREDLYPVDLVTETAERGWNSLTIPVRYGGGGGSMADALAVFEELGAASASLAVSLITIFQSQKMIEGFADESLKERWLPRYGEGLRASYALTERAHGSDIRTLDTKAVRTERGWLIEGRKAFITSGSRAELFVVLAETPVGVSAFAVDLETPGVRIEETADAVTFGLRNGPHVDLILENVEVPADALIGVEGKGLRQAMVTLSNSRTLAAGISLGIARAAFDDSLAYATQRSVFGGKVSDFQGIQWYFAEACAEIDAARLAAYQAARDLDEGGDTIRTTAVAKLLSSQVATKVASMAVQVCGARGTMETAPYGRYLRDAKAYEVAGGSSEVLKNAIVKRALANVEGA